MKRMGTMIIAWTCAAGCSSAGPTTIATGQDGPTGIAVGQGDVYWVSHEDGAVRKAPAAGGPVTTLASGQRTPSSVAVDATNVYWTNDSTQKASTRYVFAYNSDGSVMMMPRAGGTPTTLAGGQYSPQTVAVDGANVYWVNQGSTPVDGSVMKVPIGGGTPTALASGQLLIGALAVDEASVYWTNASMNGLDGNLMKVPIAGGAVTILATEWSALRPGQAWETLARLIAVDETSVYWMTGDMNDMGGSLMKVSKDGGQPTMLASLCAQFCSQEGNSGDALALDGASAYFAHGGTFFEVPIGGGAATEFAVGVGNDVVGFALDAANVYWADPMTNKVLSTPKSP